MITKNKAQEIARNALKERKAEEERQQKALREKLMTDAANDSAALEKLIESEITKAAMDGESRIYLEYSPSLIDDVVVFLFREKHPNNDGLTLTTKYGLLWMVENILKKAGYSTRKLENAQKLRISWNWRGNRNPEEEETA